MIKAFFEYSPLILFFLLTYLYGLHAATIGLIVCSIIQIIVYRIAGWTFTSLQFWGLAGVLILAPLSLLFKNPLILKMKPSVVFSLFSIIGWVVFKWKNVNWIERMFREAMSQNNTPLPGKEHPFWKSALCKTSIFFLFLSIINAIVAIYATDQQWAAFKLIGITSMTTIFFTYLIVSLVRISDSLAAQHNA